MKSFIIKTLNERYKYLFCLSQDSILNYLDEIENDASVRGFNGSVVVDQLLITGNNFNRLFVCPVSSGKIETDYAHNIKSTPEYDRLALDTIYTTPNLLQSSAITQCEIEELKDNISSTNRCYA